MCAPLLECIRIGAALTLPKIKIDKNKRVVPGWNTHARPLQQTAAFWHKLWCDCGHPTSGVLFQIKKHSKKRYKYEVRRLMRQREFIKRKRLGTALSCDPNKISGNKSATYQSHPKAQTLLHPSLMTVPAMQTSPMLLRQRLRHY